MSNGASSCRSPPSSPGRSGPAPPSRPSGSARARPVTTVLRPVASTSCRTGAQKPSPSTLAGARGPPGTTPSAATRRARPRWSSEQVQHRGGHVGAVAREHVDRGDGRRLRVGDAAQPGELAQRAQPPLADHPTGGLGARAEHPVRARLRRTDGAEREGEPGLLRPAPAGQQHRQVLLEDRLARQRVGQRRLQARPHLGPGGREGRRQRLRVPGTEHRGVGVVVEQRPLRACGDVHRQLRAQQQPDGRAQRGGPAVRRPQGRSGPLDLAHAPRHLAVPDERRLHALPPGSAPVPGCPAPHRRCNRGRRRRGAQRGRPAWAAGIAARWPCSNQTGVGPPCCNPRASPAVGARPRRRRERLSL